MTCAPTARGKTGRTDLKRLPVGNHNPGIDACRDEDQVRALQGIRVLVDDVLEDMARSGETAPEALADKRYSGKFLVRLPAELHRQLAIEAAEQNVSLNRLAVSRLSGGAGDLRAMRR